MASLSFRHIYKKYPGGVTAVSDFCLEIKDKEFLILDLEVEVGNCDYAAVINFVNVL